MSQVCNKQAAASASLDDIQSRVDAPVATGSAHLMRAGAELHLLHADLELGDARMAAVRVSSALAALASAVERYETSHRLATELGFYETFDEQLLARGPAEVLREAGGLGLIQLDDPDALAAEYASGGDRAVFTGFIADVQALSAALAAFDPAAADTDLVAWQQFAWLAITKFDRLRIRGQAMAIVNTFNV